MHHCPVSQYDMFMFYGLLWQISTIRSYKRAGEVICHPRRKEVEMLKFYKIDDLKYFTDYAVAWRGSIQSKDR